MYCGKIRVRRSSYMIGRGFEVDLCGFFDQRIDDVDLAAEFYLAFDAVIDACRVDLRRGRRF